MRVAVYSMTGYANVAEGPSDARPAALHEGRGALSGTAQPAPPVGFEMRSVNGRFLDIAMRLPDEWRGLEPALRALLTARFKRGKIELRLTGAAGAENAVP